MVKEKLAVLARQKTEMRKAEQAESMAIKTYEEGKEEHSKHLAITERLVTGMDKLYKRISEFHENNFPNEERTIQVLLQEKRDAVEKLQESEKVIQQLQKYVNTWERINGLGGLLEDKASAQFEKTNIGKVTNKGLEIALGGTLLKTNDFSWNSSLFYSKNENTVEELSEGLDIPSNLYTLSISNSFGL